MREEIGRAVLLLGRCEERMRDMPAGSVDAIVTDPPYHLTAGKKGGTGPASVNLESPYGRARVTTGFMGMKWDGGDIAFSVEMWAEALRVLKPGGHLLAFGGARTYHRMVCAIEDAGFEIRDQIMWVYGSGFPKSLDVSKAIDKAAGAEREFEPAGNAVKRMIPGADQNASGSWIKDSGREYQPGVSRPATDAARQWQGWGTALKPAHEPICVARKPLDGTVAANVLQHGTGALNIDGCRVGESKRVPGSLSTTPNKVYGAGLGGHAQDGTESGHDPNIGRWPANLIHDGSDEVTALFPAQAGAAAPVKGTEPSGVTDAIYGKFAGRVPGQFYADAGSAARFFYSPKADADDRHEGMQRPGRQFARGATLRDAENLEARGNHHPTVKPTELMRYLCRLVTPPGGLVFDPFMGSGSTGRAALLEGFAFLGVELDAAHFEIARQRIAAAKLRGHQPGLFTEAAP